MKELLCNVFTLDTFSLIMEKLNINITVSWKNLIQPYPIFLKRYYIPRDFIEKSVPCITLMGMYFLWFITTCKVKDNIVLMELLQNQGLNTFKDYYLWQYNDNTLLFSEVLGTSTDITPIISNKIFNEKLVDLIEVYDIIPVTTSDGDVIWDIIRLDSDITELETVFKTYSGYVDFY